MAGEGEGAFGLLLRSFTDEGINPDAIKKRRNPRFNLISPGCLKPLATE